KLHAGILVVPAAPFRGGPGRLLRAGPRRGRRHGRDARARRRDQPLAPGRDRAALAPGHPLGPAPLPDPRLRGIPAHPRAEAMNGMPIDAAEFRRIMGHFATGVVVVTSRDPATGTPSGLTVSAFSSVSLDPLLVLVCIEKEANSHDVIARA